MEKYSSSQRGAVGQQASPRQQESLQRVFFRLRDLHEIQDESRNELCPVFLQQDSHLKLRRESAWSAQHQGPPMNILRQLQDSQQREGKGLAERTVTSKRSVYNEQRDEDLLLSNIRLKEDNMRLFAECIRLRKMCQACLGAGSFKRPEGAREEVQREVETLRRQVEELGAVNRRLQERVQRLSAEVSSGELVLSRCEQMSAQVQALEQEKGVLVQRVLHLQKQLEVSTSRNGSRSSQSGSMNNSTQESRKTELERDRMITNMKIVHESQVRRLKGVIEELRREGSRGGGLGRGGM